jgi:hypothetical protein
VKVHIVCRGGNFSYRHYNWQAGCLYVAFYRSPVFTFEEIYEDSSEYARSIQMGLKFNKLQPKYY